MGVLQAPRAVHCAPLSTASSLIPAVHRCNTTAASSSCPAAGRAMPLAASSSRAVSAGWQPHHHHAGTSGRRVAMASGMVESWRDYFADLPSASEVRRQQGIESSDEEDWDQQQQAPGAERFSNINTQLIRKKRESSWKAKEADGSRYAEADYLSELGGKQLYNINVDHGQNVTHIDSLFVGNVLGHKSDIADGSLRTVDFRKFNNIVGDYYVAPEFLMRVAMHMTKNYLCDMGFLGNRVRVPLILGIWGEKGMGKTFQTELALKKLEAETVVMSAGELEHEWAGTPGKLIRERYRKASDMSKVRGKMTCLLIHDIDAGLGHQKNVQTTVNNQIVIGTLMNLCDNPNVVSLGLEWSEKGVNCRRTPLIVTGNDFSTMFAPLIRDGRMDKYYWSPSREDLINIVWQLYKEDGVPREDIQKLLERFPRQPLDFFGALRASLYDGQIRSWIKTEITGDEFTAENANMSALHSALVAASKEKSSARPITFEPVQVTLRSLVEEGERLENEQHHVNSHKLSVDYMKVLKKEKKGQRSMLGLMG